MWMFWHTCVFTDNSFPTSQERLGVDRGEVKDLAQWVLQPALSAVQSNQRAMALLCFACTFLTFLFYSFLIISFVQRRRQRFRSAFCQVLVAGQRIGAAAFDKSSRRLLLAFCFWHEAKVMCAIDCLSHSQISVAPEKHWETGNKKVCFLSQTANQKLKLLKVLYSWTWITQCCLVHRVSGFGKLLVVHHGSIR